MERKTQVEAIERKRPKMVIVICLYQLEMIIIVDSRLKGIEIETGCCALHVVYHGVLCFFCTRCIPLP